MLQKLKAGYTQKILSDVLLAAKIASLFGKSYMTIQRWAKADHLNLTLPAVVEIIREHEGLSSDVELLEEKEHSEV
jgi:hypothetical protein